MLDQIRGQEQKDRRRGVRRRRAAGLLSAVIATVATTLLLGGLGSGAQAHHRSGHGQGPAPSPSPTASPSATATETPSPSPSAASSDSRTPTVMTGVGIRYVGIWDCDDGLLPCIGTGPLVRGRVTSAGGPDAGRGVAGLPVSVAVNPTVGDASTGTTTTDADGWFVLWVNENLFPLSRALTWTASTDGDATHANSSTAGTFVPVPYVGP